MKFRLLLSLSLLMLIILAACSSSTPSTTPEQPSSETQTPPTVSGEAYPAPAGIYPAPAGVYPAPGQQEAVPAQSLYPESQSGDEISWIQAVALMYNGEVSQILRSQNMELTLNLKDGRSLKTFEPGEEALQSTLNECGGPCSAIEVTGP